MNLEDIEELVTGPVIELAAKTKRALESESLIVETPYGAFYVKSVELVYRGMGVTETVGYLVPDEGDGSTYDFYTPARTPAQKQARQVHNHGPDEGRGTLCGERITPDGLVGNCMYTKDD